MTIKEATVTSQDQAARTPRPGEGRLRPAVCAVSCAGRGS